MEYMRYYSPPDFPFQATNLLFLLPPIIKAIYDVYFRQKQQLPVLHSRSMAHTIMFGFLLVLIDFRATPIPYLAQGMFLAACYFTVIFDPLRNLLAGENFFYVDRTPNSDPEEDSWFDVHIYSKFPVLLIFGFKLALLGTAITLYYYFSYIFEGRVPIPRIY